MSNELRRAYAATDFVVNLGSTQEVIRVDRPLPRNVDRALRSRSTSTAAYITAWNPCSTVLSRHENETRQDALRGIVQEAGLHWFGGEGVDPTGHWEPEGSLLVVGLSRAHATELAEQYGQNAYVWIEVGQPARLVFTVHWTSAEASQTATAEPR